MEQEQSTRIDKIEKAQEEIKIELAKMMEMLEKLDKGKIVKDTLNSNEKWDIVDLLHLLGFGPNQGQSLLNTQASRMPFSEAYPEVPFHSYTNPTFGAKMYDPIEVPAFDDLKEKERLKLKTSKCNSVHYSFQIHFVLLVSRQGKVRLTKWYSPYSQKERSKVIRELSGIILTRGPKLCNFVEWRGFKVVYKRYAGLYFCMCINQDDNELEILDIIHHYVEILDRYFGSVCELDLIFNFHKAYYVLDELLIAGELQESSKRTVLRLVDAQDSIVEVAKEQASLVGNIIAQATK
ncbi:AP-1 complex subunit sigma-1-like [Durio zibethinus]|uniref:Adaptor AP-1 19 kDa protein n=1 Tax=Durio zibethinus TaxID=66656 RepID=A0A6P6B990_DURZI|nr:AP-1 complex subunit sigma-1-like [Durio zibethinus]